MDVFLHIGSGKTGTSSIQHFLASNRKSLASLGYLYPESPGRVRHQDLGFYVATDSQLARLPNWKRRHNATSPAVFRTEFCKRFVSEVSRAGLPKIVLSDEALYGQPNAALERLRGLLDELSTRVHVVVYLRRQDDHLISRYQQVVKVGETRTLVEWATQNKSRFYDYAARLKKWVSIVRPTTLTVRPFERGSFVGGSLYQDFLTAVGVDRPALAFTQTERRNESLDAEAVEFLRLLNRRRTERRGVEASIDNRSLVQKLAMRSTGPTLTLPAPVLDDFMDLWAGPNSVVASTWLDHTDGELFREPRKTHNTTTVQALDPDAGARLIQQLDLPAPQRRQARLALGLPAPSRATSPPHDGSLLGAARRRAESVMGSSSRT